MAGIRDALADEDADGALRAVVQFVDDATAAERIDEVLRREPPSSGDRRWDAAVAAAAAWVARRRGCATPGWTAAPSRFLDGPWFPAADVLGRPLPAGLSAHLLADRGIEGRLFVVGGAAMALAYGRRRVTRDVDAVFEPGEVVREVAAEVARERGLDPDWLNDGVKGFLVGTDPDATTHLDEPGLRVEVASPRYLFVLKALAARVDRDARDLVTLFDLCGFRDVDEALDHVRQHAPASLLQPKTEFLLRELLVAEECRE